MQAKNRRALATRRLYRFEAAGLSELESKYCGKPRSLDFLRRVARDVWLKHGNGKRMPVIKIAKGADTSWCLGCSEIFLATHHNTPHNFPHNTVEVLLHELVHALGFATHGTRFVRKYVELLVEFGKCDEAKLLIGLGMFKIKT